MPQFAAILPAAGSSTRFGGVTNKLHEILIGQTVLERSIAAFANREDVSQIVIPTRGKLDIKIYSEKLTVCEGGQSRAHSVWNALKNVRAEIEWVAIHDAARPLVSQKLIDETLAAAIQYGAAVGAMPVALTIKQATGPLPAKVECTVPRQKLFAMQTPQIMRRTALLHAFENCPIPLDQVTDDVQLIELMGHEVWLVAGEESNLKITTPIDLEIAKMHLQKLKS